MEGVPPIPKEPTVVEPETGEKPIIKVPPPQVDYEQKKNIIRRREIIWYSWMVLEAVLFIRFLLKLFGANQDSIFTILINILSVPFVFLFSGLFPSLISLTGENVVEWSTLFAMIVYALVAFLLSWFFRLKKPIDPREAETKAGQTLP